MVKTVAVIGAGISGLAAVKGCLEEGLEPTCFEKRDDIGGVWRFTENVEDGSPSIYKSLVSNSSKELMSLSDFPMPENFPNYLPNAKYLEYCKLYAENFQLMKHIKLKTTVCKVQRHSDFSLTGKWVVVTKNGEEKQNTTVFDAVMICTGQYTQPVLPLDSFPGIKNFKGEILHSRDYKRPVGYDGKKVLIIGMGNSGVDISTDLCTKASQVYLSTRRGVCVFRRLGPDGLPIDLSFTTRFRSLVQKTVPTAVTRMMINQSMNEQFNHGLYNIQPQCVLSKEPLINEELPSRILAGLIIMKPGVTRFTETSAHFSDGTSIDDLDVVIFATGYDVKFPFLEESVINVDNNKGFLYKKIFPVNLQQPTIAFICFIQPIGPLMVIAELQCRWATRLFKGLLKLPSTKEMKDYLDEDEIFRLQWFETAHQNWRRTDYVQYLDDLASDINVKPNILKLMLTDPVLGYKLLFGPNIAYQYRLSGPGKWAGARKAIMTQWGRMEMPLRTRGMKKSSPSPIAVLSSLMPWFLCFVVLCAAILIKG